MENNRRANRAAQFNPFDSLKGLQEALREREEKLSRVEKRELCEDEQEKVSKILRKLVKGMAVEVRYFLCGHYVSKSGIINEFNPIYQFLVVDNAKIGFEDILTIKVV